MAALRSIAWKEEMAEGMEAAGGRGVEEEGREEGEDSEGEEGEMQLL